MNAIASFLTVKTSECALKHLILNKKQESNTGLFVVIGSSV